MSHFLLKFERAGDGPGSEQAMIQSDSIGLARDKADEIADASGGGSSILYFRRQGSRCYALWKRPLEYLRVHGQSGRPTA